MRPSSHDQEILFSIQHLHSTLKAFTTNVSSPPKKCYRLTVSGMLPCDLSVFFWHTENICCCVTSSCISSRTAQIKVIGEILNLWFFWEKFAQFLSVEILMQLQDMSKKEGVIIVAGSVELATGDFDRIQEGLVFWNLLGLFPMGIHPLCLSLSYGFMSDSVMVLSGKKWQMASLLLQMVPFLPWDYFWPNFAWQVLQSSHMAYAYMGNRSTCDHDISMCDQLKFTYFS